MITKSIPVIYKALKFAEEKHAGQTRKTSGEPYVTHPIIVSYLAANFKQSQNLETIIVAAILHDTIEDTSATFQEVLKEFGPNVMALLVELTDDPDKKAILGKLEYQKAKWPGLSNYGLFIKLCDRLSNISDNPPQKYLDETKDILDNLEVKRNLTGSQRAVVDEIRKVTG